MPRLKTSSVAAILAIGAAFTIAAEPNWQSTAEDVVRHRMKDPASARFRNVAQHKDAVCGEVNAKNSFGGYIGFARFVAFHQTAFFETDDSPGEIKAFQDVWDHFCSDPKP